MEEPAIKVEHLSKTFKLPHEKSTSLKGALISVARGRRRSFERQKVLEDLSFEIKKGEFFGIVGRNGSGKSTLLKLLAGIYAPGAGSIAVNGKLTPFIELGVGFNPELTGRENVFLNGALLGFNRKEMDAMYSDIVSFAELEKFMDQKLKNYSSGMQVRLAFSIAIRAQSDILLIDEVLAVGDVAFQQKCFDYFDKLKQAKQTIILVSHDMGAIKQFCDRALLINNGVFVQIGAPAEIATTYEKLNYNQATDEASENKEIAAVQIATVDANGKIKRKFEYKEPLHVRIRWSQSKTVGIVGVVLYKAGEVVFATNTIQQADAIGPHGAKLIIDTPLGDGRYRCSATLFGVSRHDVLATSDVCTFTVYGQPVLGQHNDEWEGVTYLENRWI